MREVLHPSKVHDGTAGEWKLLPDPKSITAICDSFLLFLLNSAAGSILE
jgi:hypothetical protein